MTTNELVDALRVWVLAEETHSEAAMIVAARVMAAAIETHLREPSRQREEQLRRLARRANMRHLVNQGMNHEQHQQS